MFNNVRGGNYGLVGQAITKANQQIQNVNVETAPDYSKIANESIKGRSRERQAAIKAEADVHKVGLDAVAYKNIKQLEADTDKAVTDIKRPAKRMAGIVGAAGTLAGAFVLKKGADEDKEARLKREAETKSFRDKILGAYNNSAPEPWTPLPAPPMWQNPYADSPGGGSSGTKSGKGSSSAPQGLVSQQQGYQLLVDQGMDHENATIGAAVMMAESGGEPGIRSKPELEKRTGEMSLGLWQHNKNTGEDRHAFYGITDWSELKDPKTNARATYRLWKRAGKKWTDWGAYDNGKGPYLDYLK